MQGKYVKNLTILQIKMSFMFLCGYSDKQTIICAKISIRNRENKC